MQIPIVVETRLGYVPKIMYEGPKNNYAKAQNKKAPNTKNLLCTYLANVDTMSDVNA